MRTLIALLLLALSSCGGDNDTPSTVSVYKSTGAVQCSGGGLSLSAMARQLADGGVQVLASACGTDGNLYTAVCGAPTGLIGIFDIPASQAQTAASLSFKPLSELPAAARGPCQ